MHRSLLRSVALSAGLLLIADAAWSQIVRVRGQNGRVAGLSVSVIDQIPNGAGKDVELRVDMTTVRTQFTTDAPLRGGQSLFEIFTQDEFSIERNGFGGLGDADLSSVMSVSDSPGRSFTDFLYFSGGLPPRAGFSGFYSGNALTFTASTHSFVEGELPALDYGDGGSPLTVTSLAPNGTPSTSTPTTGIQRITSRWRGTFVHTYGDLGSYTVTAASRCCPLSARLGDDDTEPTRGVFDVSPGYVVPPNSPSQLAVSNSFANRLVFTSAYLSPPVNTRGVGPTETGSGFDGTFISADQFTGTGGEIRSLAQVTNTALVEDGLGTAFAIEIPTAGTYGLGLLSLLLAAGGVIALRR